MSISRVTVRFPPAPPRFSAYRRAAYGPQVRQLRAAVAAAWAMGCRFPLIVDCVVMVSISVFAGFNAENVGIDALIQITLRDMSGAQWLRNSGAAFGHAHP